MAQIHSTELPVPLESVEQTCLFRWAQMEEAAYPDLHWLHHIPNGGTRNKREAAQLKMQGVKPGVSDICLPVPCGGYHGLYIELKRIRGGRTSDEQKEWLEGFKKRGYFATECKGWVEATEVIMKYLKLEA
jgi:hypothetical protein